MRKITIYLMSALFIGMMATNADTNATQKAVDWEEIPTIIDKTAESGNMPELIDDGGATRGAGFNGDYVFVASRQDGDNVYYWDVDDPDAEAGTLDLTGVEGGYFDLSDMTAVGDHIFVSNMVFADDQFKMYHWDGIDAEPSTLIDYETPVRLGDAFSVIGDPEENAMIIVSANGAAQFYSWEMEDGSLVDADPEVIDWEANDQNTNFSRVTAIEGSDNMLVSGPAFGPVLTDSDYQYINDIPVDFFPGWPMYAHIIHFDDQRFLAYAHVGEEPAENILYILDMNDGETVDEAMDNLVDAGFEESVLHSATLGNIANLNASVSVDADVDEDGNLNLMAFAGGNGFIAQQIAAEEEPLPPADVLAMTTLMDKTGEDLPAEIGSGGNARGAAIYMDRYVVVPSREDGPNVWVWDSENPGDDPVALPYDEDVIADLTFPINYVRTAGDAIYVSNLSLNPSGDGWAQGVFRIYRWNDLDSDPEIVIDYDVEPGRLGDAFSILGDPAGDGHVLAHINDENIEEGRGFRKWNFVDGEIQNPDEPELITVDGDFNMNSYGVYNNIEGEDELFLVTGNGMGIAIADLDGNVHAYMDTDILSTRTMDPRIFYNEDKRYLSYVVNEEWDDEGAFYDIIDISMGDDVLEAVNTINTLDDLNARRAYSFEIGAGAASLSATHGISHTEDGNILLLSYVVGRGFVFEIVGDYLPPADPQAMTTLMDKIGEDLPAEIGTGGNARGAALYMDRYVVVPSREDGPNVWVWDSENPGDDPVALPYDEDVIADLVFPINYARTAGDAIYVSNLTLNPSGDGWAQGVFRVYRWNDLESDPEIVIDYDVEPGRLGDAFSIIGDPKEDGHIVAHINTTKDFRVWTFEEGVLINEDTPELTTLDIDPEHINDHGVYNEIPGEDNLFLVTSNNMGLMLADLDGQVHAEIGTDIIDMRAYDPNIFYMDDHRYLTYTINNEGNPDVGAVYQIVDLSIGETLVEAFEAIATSYDLENRIVHSKKLGDGHANLTSVNDVGYNEDDIPMILAYVVGTGFTLEIVGEDMVPHFTVTFDVKDEDGDPIEDAIVTFDEETYEEGHYVFEDVLEGTYEYMVEKQGYYTEEGEVTVEEDITVEITLIEEETVEVATLAELRDMPEDGTLYHYTGDAVIVAMDDFRNRKFLQDETAAIMIDDDPGIIETEYDLYDVITDVFGRLNTYNDLLQFQPTRDTPEALDNTPVDPVVFMLDEVTSDDQAKLIEFEGVHFVDIEEGERFENGTNYTISDGESEFVVRTDFFDVDYIGEPIPQTNVDIAGVILQYQETLQLVPRFADDMEEAAESFEVTFHVDLSLAIEYELLDGFDPDIHHIMMTGAMFDWTEPDSAHEDMVFELVEEDPMTYAITLHLEAGAYEYKYFSDLLGEGWGGGEWDGDPNRVVEVEDDMFVEEYFGYLDDEVSAPDLDEVALNIYPVPASRILNIDVDANISDIRMIDMLGKVVYSNSEVNDHHEINVGNFDTGIYFIQVTTDKGVKTQRVQITR